MKTYPLTKNDAIQILQDYKQGIDDGKNKVSSELLFIIWETLRENDIKIPFPQREVRILDERPKLSIKKKS